MDKVRAGPGTSPGARSRIAREPPHALSPNSLTHSRPPPLGTPPPVQLREKLDYIIQANSLQQLYPAERLDGVLRRLAAVDWAAFSAAWGVPLDEITDLAPLAL